MHSSSNSSNFNEHAWIIHVQKTLDQDLDLDDDNDHDHDFSVTIFNVPKILMATDPDSYVPHQIAIGPYHHFRPDLYEMERCKLDAARRRQKTIQPVKIHHIVDQFSKFESRIRSCYHKFLDFSGKTLAWMMAVDACFLLEFLRVYGDNNDENPRQRTHNSVLRDVIMLENQIPLFLLRNVLEICGQTRESADRMLFVMIMGLSEELSPLKTHAHAHAHESAHFVDFLYNLLVPMPKTTENMDETAAETLVEDENTIITRFIDKIRVSIKTIISSKTIRLAIKLPISVILNLPIINVFKQPLEHMLSNTNTNTKENATNKPPLLEEISIPSVSELVLAGVNFAQSTNNNITTIQFDESTSTFYLPTVVLEANTKLVLRNLVAYEACMLSGPLVFTRYVEMMNGIIDTKEDARLLRERGIIVNHLNSDQEAADMWNGMNKSIRMTNVLFLDRVIENVNKYYRTSWKIKVKKFVNFYVFESWQFVLLLLVSMFFLLMCFQIVAIVIDFSINPKHKM